MNIDLMHAWNSTTIDGHRWEDLSVAQQHRLEDFAEACSVCDHSVEIAELEEELETAQEQLVAASKRIAELESAQTPKETK